MQQRVNEEATPESTWEGSYHSDRHCGTFSGSKVTSITTTAQTCTTEPAKQTPLKIVKITGLVPIMDSPVRAKWVTWDPVIESLASFLDKWKPSGTLVSNIEWLCVSRLTASNTKTNTIHDLMSAWEQLCYVKKDNVSCLDVEELARKHNVMSGKWLIFLPSELIDNAWKTIANAIVEGSLGNDAKVSTICYGGHLISDTDVKPLSRKKSSSQGKSQKKKSDNSCSSSRQHVICVYGSNFDDIEGVFDLRTKLFNLGFEDKLRFKPDAYTFCGIYSQNRWGISPTIYCS